MTKTWVRFLLNDSPFKEYRKGVWSAFIKVKLEGWIKFLWLPWQWRNTTLACLKDRQCLFVGRNGDVGWSITRPCQEGRRRVAMIALKTYKVDHTWAAIKYALCSALNSSHFRSLSTSLGSGSHPRRLSFKLSHVKRSCQKLLRQYWPTTGTGSTCKVCSRGS